MLVVDDMRSEAAQYPGMLRVHTPHLEHLARRSLVLKRAYVQQGAGAASRTSFLTGRRPETTRVFDTSTYWRTEAGNFTSLPQFFKERGYHSVGIGKVFPEGAASGYNGDAISWSEPTYHPDTLAWQEEKKDAWWLAEEDKQLSSPLSDTLIARRATEVLERLAPAAVTGIQPFLLAVGFMRPRLPFLCPNRYDRYYLKDDIQLPPSPHTAQGLPDIAWSNYRELRSYRNLQRLNSHGSMNTTLPNSTVVQLRRAYSICVSYVDDMVGQVLGKLDELGLRNDTVVVFLSDNGVHLGENGLWEKYTNTELATHAPLTVTIPGRTDSGLVSDQLVEFVDIFPTLVEAAGFERLPLCPLGCMQLCTEGISFLPLIDEPTRVWKTAVFSQYPRMSICGEIVMGYSIRTQRFRYTEWVKMGLCATHYRRDHVKKKELYDHRVDPGESINLFRYKAYQTVLESLHDHLVAGWRGALPPPNTPP